MCKHTQPTLKNQPTHYLKKLSITKIRNLLSVIRNLKTPFSHKIRPFSNFPINNVYAPAIFFVTLQVILVSCHPTSSTNPKTPRTKKTNPTI